MKTATTSKKITAVMYTFSMCMFWIQTEDGEKQSMTYRQLVTLVGQSEADRLNKIAHTGGLTGHWHKS